MKIASYLPTKHELVKGVIVNVIAVVLVVMLIRHCNAGKQLLDKDAQS